MENVMNLIDEIKDSIKKKSASQKDEVKVMKAMLNDRDYVVQIYDKTGVVGQMSPAVEARNMAASIISGAARIPYDEAMNLALGYDFRRAEAESMVEISKEFVNTYLETGRKLPLGGREDKNACLYQENVLEKEGSYPMKVGKDKDGEDVYDKGITIIPPHKSIKTDSNCPDWLR